MPTKVRIVSPEGRCTVLPGQTDFATIKEKGRELLVSGDVVCHNQNYNHEREHEHHHDHGKAMERARAQRESYDVRFSLSCSSPGRRGETTMNRRDGTEGEVEREGGEKVVSVEVEWMPPRSR